MTKKEEWTVWSTTGDGAGCCARLPDEVSARRALAHLCRDRARQQYEFALRDPNNAVVVTSRSTVATAKKKGSGGEVKR